MRTTHRAALGTIAVSAIALGAAASPAAALETTACADTGHPSFAKVQLFAGENCAGGQMVVKADDPGPNRSDFRSFANFDGRRYDVDNTRSSLRIAPGTCVRLYDGVDYTGTASTDICAGSKPLEWNLARFDDKASSMKVFSAGATPTPAPRPTPKPAPKPTPAPAPAPGAGSVADRATTWAESKVGTRQCSPEQTAWNRDYSRSFPCSEAWCGVFIGQAYEAAGHKLKFGHAYTEWIHDEAKAGRSGLRTVPVSRTRRGDFLLILDRDLPAHRAVGHVALARGPVRAGKIPTVEGNISNKVVLRERSLTARYKGRTALVLVARPGA